MRHPRTVAAILVVVALLVIGAACGSDEASPDTAGLSPLATELVTSAPQEPTAEPGDTSGGQVSSGMMVPRPESIEVLVRMSHVIVLGTISAVRRQNKWDKRGAFKACNLDANRLRQFSDLPTSVRLDSFASPPVSSPVWRLAVRGTYPPA